LKKKPGPTAHDIRGAARLAVDTTLGITEIVESMHANVARVPLVTSSKETNRTRGLTRLVYGAVRGVTRAVGTGLDAAIALTEPLLATLPTVPAREALLSVLNGVFGDHLAAQNNPLAITMSLRHQGVALALTRDGLRDRLPTLSGKIVVLVHGLCMNDLQWCVAADESKKEPAHNHGAALQRDMGYTPLYLHYNSGQHVSTNGHAFASLLKTLVTEWPIKVESIIIVAHSMGGLVSRSAIHYGTKSRHAWCKKIDKLICLGTPHLGAPLERGGRWIDVLLSAAPYASPLAKLGKARSAGITDLRHGSIIDEDWNSGAVDYVKVVPLPARIRSYAIAARIAHETLPSGAVARAQETIIGDGLVPVASALGQHLDPARTLRFPKVNQIVLANVNHMGLLKRAQVYPALLAFVRS
jgi:pimeloyl-ACP methyl ester carboxylesterase